MDLLGAPGIYLAPVAHLFGQKPTFVVMGLCCSDNMGFKGQFSR